MAKTNIAIIGAGITGVTTAWALTQRGFDVSLYDRNNYAAMETSFANGGQLSASNAEVWNHWSSVIKGLKWILRDDAPLKMSLTPSWHKYSWMAEFLANMRNYENNTVETAKMAIAARQHLLAMASDAGIDFDLEKRGILHFYGTKKSLDHARNVSKLLAKAGLERRELSPLEIRRIEPTLTGQMVGGFYTESDLTGDIHKFSTGLAEACERAGAVFQRGAAVTQLVRSQSGISVKFEQDGHMHQADHDAIVICAGVHSREFARQMGDRVNIYPVKGYSITVNLNDKGSQNGAPWVSLLDDDAKIVTSRLGKDRFRIAGTAEFDGYNRDIRDSRVRPLIAWCEKFFPQVSTEHVVPWAGLRPMMPNMMPKVGTGRAQGVFYNTGHGHLGWTLSGATAEIIAGQIESRLKPIGGAVPHTPFAAAAE